MRTLAPAPGTAPPVHVAASDHGPLFSDLMMSAGRRAPIRTRERSARRKLMVIPPRLSTNTGRGGGCDAYRIFVGPPACAQNHAATRATTSAYSTIQVGTLTSDF